MRWMRGSGGEQRSEIRSGAVSIDGVAVLDRLGGITKCNRSSFTHTSTAGLLCNLTVVKTKT